MSRTLYIIILIIIIIIIAFLLLEWFGFIDIIPGLGEPRPGGTDWLSDLPRLK